MCHHPLLFFPIITDTWVYMDVGNNLQTTVRRRCSMCVCILQHTWAAAPGLKQVCVISRILRELSWHWFPRVDRASGVGSHTRERVASRGARVQKG